MLGVIKTRTPAVTGTVGDPDVCKAWTADMPLVKLQAAIDSILRAIKVCPLHCCALLHALCSQACCRLGSDGTDNCQLH